MDAIERTTLAAICEAAGLLPLLELRKDVLRRMGMDGSRTRGFSRLLAQALQRLERRGYISQRTGARSAPRARHASVIGRQVKHHKVGCCTVTEDERKSMEQVKTYACVYYEATEAGVKALRT